MSCSQVRITCAYCLLPLRKSDAYASTYGKAFSVFGRELDMMTQDSLRFYKSHAVYPNFGGVVLDREEGRKIAECLGDGKAAILQNHGLITVCHPHLT